MEKHSLTWIGGNNTFALGIGHLRAIQKACNAGPMQVATRLASGDWVVDDLYEVIRQGLIGGGMPDGEATELVSKVMQQHPLIEFTITARAILAVALVGDDEGSEGEDPEGEDQGGEPQSSPENGNSETSTGPAQ